MEREHRIEQGIFGALLIIVCATLIVIGMESSRKVDVLTAQVKAMRQGMEDAGYVQAEPKIARQR